jgi:hypothetical protein
MKLFKKVANLFKRKGHKDSLRDKCVEAYGEEYGILYDKVCSGEPMGGFLETIMFLDMLEAVKKGKPLKLNDEPES